MEHSRAARAHAGNKRLVAVAREFRPDVVHSLRLFHEATTTYYSELKAPHVASVWGQEFVLYGQWALFRGEGRRVLSALSGLTADCRRDIDLAESFGSHGPNAVLPTNLGIPDDFFCVRPDPTLLELARGRPIVVNPRGLRSYVLMDQYLEAVRILIDRGTDAFFVLLDVAQSPPVRNRIIKLGLSAHVKVTGRLSRSEVASALRAATIVVSPTSSDGTPNTLLEAMAAGAFPVFADLLSVREWIRPGENGLLFDARDPRCTADALSEALRDGALREKAQSLNAAMARAARRAPSVHRLLELYECVLTKC